MQIHVAQSDAEIAACYPVMRELRHHIAETEFVLQVQSQQKAGYRLAYVAADGAPVAVAGFRLGESLSWGRYLYVDDLVTPAAERSKGYGAALLDWLYAYAKEQGCGQMHPDSGLQRVDAHRFYEREGMRSVAYHFVKVVA